jgi:hypothetical protein
MSEQQVLNLDERRPFSGRALAKRSVVPLDRLPDGLKFPDELLDSVSYDSERRLLVFRGFMSSADYFFLRSCSDDSEYVQALNELHDKSAFEIHYRPQIVPTWLWALVTASFALAGLVWFCWLIGSQ